MQHDRYDEDILKQLKRIATALEKIERKTPSPKPEETKCQQEESQSMD